MNTISSHIFITCAVTGSGNTQNKSPLVPITPKEIAKSAIAAAKAGAAIVHLHVRDPNTGKPARKVALYEEVVARIRDSNVDVMINLTAGMGGDIVIGSAQQPLPLNKEGTDMIGADERLEHIALLKPDICTLDCGTMNFSEGDYIMTNTPSVLRAMARKIKELGVKPEIEIFDTGHLWMAKTLVQEGLIENPVLTQLCMGIPYGIPNDLTSFNALVSQLPKEWLFSAFSIGRMQLPYVALAAISGGNVRVGLEDNLYLDKGVLATNEALVNRAKVILENMNITVLNPAQTRAKLQIQT